MLLNLQHPCKYVVKCTIPSLIFLLGGLIVYNGGPFYRQREW